MSNSLLTVGILIIAALGLYSLVKGRRRDRRLIEFEQKRKQHLEEITKIDKEIQDGIEKSKLARKKYEKAKRDAAFLFNSNKSDN